MTNPAWIGSVGCVKVECCDPRIFPTLTKGVMWQIVTNLSHSEKWKQLTVDSTPPTILRLPSSPQRQLEQTTPAASWEVQSCTWDDALVIMRTKMVMTQCKIEFTYASYWIAKIWRLVGCSKSVWHAIGKSWPFGQENLFCPKKTEKHWKSWTFFRIGWLWRVLEAKLVNLNFLKDDVHKIRFLTVKNPKS